MNDMSERRGQGRVMVKNGISGLLASGLGGLIQFLTLLAIIRMLPVPEFGRFSVLLSFGLIVQFIADFGLSNILVKEFAARAGEERDLRGKSQGLIWCISIALMLAAAIAIFIIYRPWEHRAQALLMAFMGVSLFQSAGYTAVIRAREEMEWNAYGHIVHKVVLLAAIWIVAKMGGGLWGVVHAHVISGLVLLGFYASVVNFRYGRARLRWDPAYWQYLFKRSIPLGSGLFLRQFAWQVDILVLSLLATDRIVGLFSAPYRIFAACLLIAQVMAIPVFPLMSRLAAAKDQAGLQRVYDLSVRMLFLLGVPAAAVTWTYADLIVTYVLGSSYAETSQVVRLLALGFPLMFAGSIFPFAFTSIDRQITFVVTSAGGLLLRVGIAFILIPSIGFTGACVAVLCSEVGVLTMWIVSLWRAGMRLDLGKLLIPSGVGLPAMILLLNVLGSTHSWWQALVGMTTASAAFGLLLWTRGLSASQRDRIAGLALRRRTRPQSDIS